LTEFRGVFEKALRYLIFSLLHWRAKVAGCGDVRITSFFGAKIAKKCGGEKSQAFGIFFHRGG
jgi:hypothetical protein